MGKRKQRADQSKTPHHHSDFMPNSSRMDSLLTEKSSHTAGTSALKPLPSIMDCMDGSAKLPNGHQPAGHHHSRTILLRHPHHYYGRQYSRRNSVNHADTSSSHGKGASLPDEKLSFKLATQCNSESGFRAESREKASRRPERTRSCSAAMNTASTDVVKMDCGMCQKQLKRRSYTLGNTISSSDLSVVAILVCGHVYHADCLETKTSHEDRRDPPCPLCLSLLPQVDASRI